MLANGGTETAAFYADQPGTVNAEFGHRRGRRHGGAGSVPFDTFSLTGNRQSPLVRNRRDTYVTPVPSGATVYRPQRDLPERLWRLRRQLHRRCATVGGSGLGRGGPEPRACPATITMPVDAVRAQRFVQHRSQHERRQRTTRPAPRSSTPGPAGPITRTTGATTATTNRQQHGGQLRQVHVHGHERSPGSARRRRAQAPANVTVYSGTGSTVVASQNNVRPPLLEHAAPGHPLQLADAQLRDLHARGLRQRQLPVSIDEFIVSSQRRAARRRSARRRCPSASRPTTRARRPSRGRCRASRRGLRSAGSTVYPAAALRRLAPGLLCQHRVGEHDETRACSLEREPAFQHRLPRRDDHNRSTLPTATSAAARAACSSTPERVRHEVRELVADERGYSLIELLMADLAGLVVAAGR